MSDFEEIFRFQDPWFVNRIVVDRELDGGPLSLEITFSNEKDSKVVKIQRPNDEDCMSCLLDAERVVFSRERGSQREYGSYKVECYSESYSEFWCDSVT